MAEVLIKRHVTSILPQLDPALPLLVQQILQRRGIERPEQLDLSTKRLAHFALLKGIDVAATLVVEALRNERVMCICGDFDADGATSIALMVSVLRAMGARQLHYIVPNRFADGYGLSPAVVAQALSLGSELIITVDSGISCHAGVTAAVQAGLTVVVTDHHLPGAVLPPAHAIVNPNQPGCEFPSKSIAGVGVAFYLLLAIRQQLREQGIATPNLAEWLDLVALGTVADVVKFDDLNRILVQQGLQRIRSGHCRPGIQALLQLAGRDAQQLQAGDLGFSLGPRINAAGRLDDMATGIECLLATDLSVALELAQQLDDFNRQRRSIETSMRESAQHYVAELQRSLIELPPILVLHQADWHQGVVGLVAGRMKDQVHRPVIAFAQADDGSLKGSARSIPGLHIRDLLERVHSLHPQLIERFGGHAMAAGLSLQAEHLDEFTKAVTSIAHDWLSSDQLTQTMWSDGELDASALQQPFAELLERLGPWGQGFTEPRFDGEFKLLQQRLVGEKHLKLVLEGPDRVTVDAIAFNVDLAVWPDPSVQRIHALYLLQLNHFRGRTSVQLQLEHLVALR